MTANKFETSKRIPLSWRIGLSSMLTVALLLTLAYLLHKTSSEGSNQLLTDASTSTHAACDEIRTKLDRGVLGHSLEGAKAIAFQDALLEIVLDHYDGVEGGIWSKERAFESYAFPTYDGASTKKDVPRSEMDFLQSLAAKSVDSNSVQETRWEGRREALVAVACPVNTVAAVWTLMRVPVLSGNEFDHLKWFVVGLLALVVLLSANSYLLLRNWSSDLRRLQKSIRDYPLGDFPELEQSHEPDLQPVVLAFNELNTKLKASHREASELSLKLGQAERLTLLGKMSAGIAHEIRNPIATLKLKLENIGVQPEERFASALPILLDQISRVDRLIQMLLAMTRPFDLQPEEIQIAKWFDESFTSTKNYADSRHVKLRTHCEVERWRFDGFHLGRALENLLHNAIAFSPEGATVEVLFVSRHERLIIEVRDHGKGLTHEERASLFQPFVSNRTDGTGLGLILAKEIAEAHGGSIAEIGDAHGACFRMEIPWQKS